MIAYLEGKILKKAEDRVLLLTHGVGYEVMLPGYMVERLKPIAEGADLTLYIYHQQSERQPKPVLIGFHRESEKDFFQRFISVADIGPLKAIKAMDRPVAEIAAAIEAGDARQLSQLKGIGKRTAQKIIASLGGTVDRFVLKTGAPAGVNATPEETSAQVYSVLVDQLGQKPAEARRRVDAAVARNPAITDPGALLDDILAQI